MVKILGGPKHTLALPLKFLGGPWPPWPPRFRHPCSQQFSKHRYLPWGFPKGGIPVKDLCVLLHREGGYHEIVNALSQCAVGQVANLLYLYFGLACTCVLLHFLTYLIAQIICIIAAPKVLKLKLKKSHSLKSINCYFFKKNSLYQSACKSQ